MRSAMLYLIAGAVAAYAVYQSFFADSPEHRPPSSRPQSHDSSQPPRLRDERQHSQSVEDRPPSGPQSHDSPRRRDERQRSRIIDSSKRDSTPIEAYTALRAKAKQEGDLMKQCYRQSQEAYKRRDHAHAKALSEEAKRHEYKMESLNGKASAAVFKENNQNKGGREVDLHGLYVKEAIAYSVKAVTDARRRGDSEIHLIVGQGTHSDGGVSRLKPAIQEDMRMRGILVEVHPRNPGVLVVQLDSR